MGGSPRKLATIPSGSEGTALRCNMRCGGATVAWLSFLTIAAGVPLGKNVAYQLGTSMSVNPCFCAHGSYGLKVDSDVSSGIELRVRIRRNDAGRVIFFYDQRSGAPCRKIRAPDDGRSHPPAPATEIGFTWR